MKRKVEFLVHVYKIHWFNSIRNPVTSSFNFPHWDYSVPFPIFPMNLFRALLLFSEEKKKAFIQIKKYFRQLCRAIEMTLERKVDIFKQQNRAKLRRHII